MTDIHFGQLLVCLKYAITSKPLVETTADFADFRATQLQRSTPSGLQELVSYTHTESLITTLTWILGPQQYLPRGGWETGRYIQHCERYTEDSVCVCARVLCVYVCVCVCVCVY